MRHILIIHFSHEYVVVPHYLTWGNPILRSVLSEQAYDFYRSTNMHEHNVLNQFQLKQDWKSWWRFRAPSLASLDKERLLVLALTVHRPVHDLRACGMPVWVAGSLLRTRNTGKSIPENHWSTWFGVSKEFFMKTILYGVLGGVFLRSCPFFGKSRWNLPQFCKFSSFRIRQKLRTELGESKFWAGKRRKNQNKVYVATR
jgi:hypothetical protein